MKNVTDHQQKHRVDERDMKIAQIASSPLGFRWAVKDVALVSTSIVSILLIGLPGFTIALSNLLSSQEQDRRSLPYSLAVASIEVVTLLGSVYFLGLRRRKQPWAAIGLRPLTRSWLLVSVVLGLLAVLMVPLVAYIIQQLLGLALANPQLPFVAPDGLSWLGRGAMLLLAGVAIPFAEEVFFRGVLYKALRDRWGIWLGASLSSLVFAGVHGSLQVGMAAFFIGLLCVFAYEKSQSLWSAFFVHAVYNSISLVALYSMLATSKPIPWV
jgi:membrane protease YdiL (CAAX protease family)